MFFNLILSLDLPNGPGFCWMISISLSLTELIIATCPYLLKVEPEKISKSSGLGFVLLSSLAEINVGTSVRHRSILLVIILFTIASARKSNRMKDLEGSLD